MDPRLLKRKAQTKPQHGHDWFFRLNPPSDYDNPKWMMKNKTGDTGLFGFYGQGIKTGEGVILARDVIGKKKRESKFTKPTPPSTSKSSIVSNKPKVHKQFAYFPSLDSAIEHIEQWPEDQRYFYELIGSTDTRQKPYFDLDITLASIIEHVQRNHNTNKYSATKTGKKYSKREVIESAKMFAEEILMDILAVICYKFLLRSEKNGERMNFNNINIYETIYPYDNNTQSLEVEKDNYDFDVDDFSPELLKRKYSYHVIIQGYYFSNHEKMKAFGQSVRDEYNKLCHEQENPSKVEPNDEQDTDDEVSKNYMYIIDDIWNSTRQLRLLGSSKAESKSKKQLYSLNSNVLEILKRIPQRYSNVFASRLYQSPLKSYATAEDQIMANSFVTNVSRCELLE